MTIEEIRELIKVVAETGISELEVQRGENRVRIRRTPEINAHNITLPASFPVAAQAPPPNVALPEVPVPTAAPAAAPAPTAKHAPSAAEPPEIAADASLVYVKSPIVGTFYEAPSPGAPPFVQVGDTVKPGQVLCIIESMKLMNEIEAEIAGVIVNRLVENAQPVEYGEALFAIRPL
ncbi:MAG: acetyl-CoA carboxylase biotin carboxyl carrier protein [Bryobacterales bacterium]|nr:acetyl-CoA carboxylase biotin carboxyl carrier protein [Bryobacteraceae bacterium]MDW8129343.1 acetyl-CoA carboxylase biotin carboxyl carrier protein [Bryobacterales bacterium]